MIVITILLPIKGSEVNISPICASCSPPLCVMFSTSVRHVLHLYPMKPSDSNGSGWSKKLLKRFKKIKRKIKKKSKAMALASLVSFQKQKLQSSHPSGCSVSFVIKLRGVCNQGKGKGEIFMMLNRS